MLGGSSGRESRMAPDDPLPEVAPYEWLLDGFRLSLARFRDVAYEDVPPVETYVPLFEALNWASSIAWRLGTGNRPDLLKAVEYARNAVHHDWARALDLMPRAYGEGRYGEGRYGGFVWRWKASENLQVQRADAKREPLYRGLLAGRSVLDTLRRLDAELPDEST
jgi:hypothetical protein